jgi:4-hydroxy-3-methylbut-2-enyl diphosphate reductase IspH
MAIAPRSDVIVVIGSANSSNTRALEKLARAMAARRGCSRATPPTQAA